MPAPIRPDARERGGSRPGIRRMSPRQDVRGLLPGVDHVDALVFRSALDRVGRRVYVDDGGLADALQPSRLRIDSESRPRLPISGIQEARIRCSRHRELPLPAEATQVGAVRRAPGGLYVSASLAVKAGD